MKNKELVISDAIKRGKWLDIIYKNSNNETTYFWIAIKDINLKDKILNCSIFNEPKGLNVLGDINLRFDAIESAKILEFTNYDVPEEFETHYDYFYDFYFY